jgi:PAS domain S-box-containing protein
MDDEKPLKAGANDDGRNFRLLVEGITDYAIYMLDVHGLITNWNAGAERIKGYRADEIVGRHFSVFYTPEDKARGLPDRALGIARDESHYLAEGWRVRKDGSFFWASVVIDPIRDDAGELVGFAKITRDISERKAAEERLALMQRQLAEAQKMDALGQLTGGVAHDFNNLLMIISGSIHVLKREVVSEKSTRALQAIEAASQRAASLTKQLLTFARRQSVNPQPIDLAERIEGLSDVLNTGLGGSVTLTIDVAPDVSRVVVDVNEFETALVNLVVNARDAMPDGGLVAITAGNAGTADQVEISVTDTGVGIPDDVAAKVFDPFFTTKPVGKGTGLGLSQVHGFVHQAGGTLNLHSKLGEGTRITIFLPRATGEVAETAHGQGQVGSGTVLLVEDNPDVATASRDLLEQLGYSVRLAPDSAAALLDLQRGGVDVVCSDIVMPGKMDGIALAHAIRIKYPEIPVLLMTGYSEAASTLGSQFPVLRKPYQLHELSRELQKLSG